MNSKSINGKTVSIGGQAFKIIVKDKLDQDNWGQTIPGESRILLKGTLDEFPFIETFWHELIHCIFYNIGRRKEARDEGFCDTLGRAIWCLFKDNPWLFDLTKGKATRAKKNRS